MFRVHAIYFEVIPLDQAKACRKWASYQDYWFPEEEWNSQQYKYIKQIFFKSS